MNVQFSAFLSVIHKYIASDSSQPGFMYICFQKLMVEPFVESDESRDEKDNYYPFSKKSEESLAKKVYNGTRLLPSKTAKFISSHFSAEKMHAEIDEFDDSVRENLCRDLAAFGFLSNLDEVANDVPAIFKRFIEAAIDEKDTTETGILSKSEISIESESATNLDALLLLESGNCCPICGKLLMQNNPKGRSKKEYTVTQIFPSTLDRSQYAQFSKYYIIGRDYNSQENLIALCSSCAADYKADLQLSEFKKLLEIKKQLKQRQKLQQLSDRSELEKEIKDVINGLIEIDQSTELIPLKMDAIVVDKKIGSEYFLLRNDVKNDAVQYYRYIESLFADLEERRTGTFDIIASQFRQMYLKLKAEAVDAPSIIDGISSWVKAKAGTGLENDTAIRIVVSFFIQNCEVFDEIPE